MRRFQTRELSQVVDDATTRPTGLTRHDLGDGVAVSFLFDGDEQRPGTCQWRIIARDAEQLREQVGQLMEILKARGVRCQPARFSGLTGYFQDEGPWGTPP